MCQSFRAKKKKNVKTIRIRYVRTRISSIKEEKISVVKNTLTRVNVRRRIV